MLQVSRKFEYGLHAITYLATKGQNRVVTVKELSEELGFSQEFLSKAMQSLKKAGITKSVQGLRGGFRLIKPITEITVADIAVATEGEPHLVQCNISAERCHVYATCQHKSFMNTLQHKMHELLATTTIVALLEQSDIPFTPYTLIIDTEETEEMEDGEESLEEMESSKPIIPFSPLYYAPVKTHSK